MKVIPTALAEVLVFEPRVHEDQRGFFLESYHEERYREAGLDEIFVQDSHSSSCRGTLRGLHLQCRNPQGKLVRVLEGEIFDVGVDVRRGSPTFRAWVGRHLSATNFLQIYFPPGFAHGFCALSDRAQVEYKCTRPYDRDDELVIAWDDPDLGITWPVADPLLSERDRQAPRLADLETLLPAYDPR